MIRIKTEAEIAVLRENAQLLQGILQQLIEEARVGTSTLELDRKAERMLAAIDAQPAFKGYRGYPATVCTSLNAEVVHGIPKASRILRPGDVLSIDIGMIRRGLCADLATTVVVEEELGSEKARFLIKTAEEALWKGVRQATAGQRVGDISHAIQKHVNDQGLSIVTNFVGHGIGREMHEEPQVPNYGTPGQGPLLKNGMVLCIEPMVADGHTELLEIEVQDDGWTAVAPGATVGAHYEAMVFVRKEPMVLGAGVFARVSHHAATAAR